MSFRGNRRRQALLAAAIAAVAVIAIVVFVANREDHLYDEPVAGSTLDDFPTRGSLADDEELVESAADVWREGSSYRAETKPGGQIELLWAGHVEAEAVKGLVTDKDTPKRVKVVILQSTGQIATFAERQIDSDREFDGIGIRDLSVYSAPLIGAPGDLTLTDDASPTSFEAVDESAGRLTVEADDGVISSTREGVVLRLDRTTKSSSGLEATSGIFLGGQALVLGGADLDRTWTLLGDPGRTEPVRDAIRVLLKTPRDRPGAVLELAKLEIVSESMTPDGRSLLVLTALGQGGPGGIRTAAAVDYRAATDRSHTVMALGRADGGDSWVGSAWMTRAKAEPYLVVAGGGELETIQVYLGRKSERLDAPGGVVVPDGAVVDGELPPVVVAGFAKEGTVVPTMPNE